MASQLFKEKIYELDYLRGIAFLAVALQHTIGIYIRKNDVSVNETIFFGMLFNLVKFAVPCFIFISGMVLFYNYYQGRKLIYLKFIALRTREILIPYIVWSAIYIIFYHSVSLHYGFINVFEVILAKLLTGNAAYHLWYIVLIFQFYLLVPIFLITFHFFHNKIKCKQFWIIFFATAYLLLMWQSYHFRGGEGILANLMKYRDRFFLYWLLYFLWGGIVGLQLDFWREWVLKRKKYIFTAFLLFLIVINYELLAGLQGNQLNLNISTTLKPSMVFYNFFSIAVFYLICLKLACKNSIFQRILRSFGKYSLPAYLMHAIILNYSVILILKFSIIQDAGYIIASLLSFFSCTLISLCLSILLSKMPYGKYITGSVR